MSDLCNRETELVDAMMSGAWANPASSIELRRHVQACSSCAEVLAVSSALLDGRLEDEAQMRVPSAGSTWWRMELRAKREARAAATSAVELTQAAIIISTLAIAFTLAGVGALFFGFFDSFTFHAPSLAGATVAVRFMVLGGVALLLAMPVAIYFAAKE